MIKELLAVAVIVAQVPTQEDMSTNDVEWLEGGISFYYGDKFEGNNLY